jgi:elongation factor P
MSLTMNDLERGMVILLEGAPHEVLAATHSHFGRGGSVVEAKLRNLKTGSVITRNFKQSDAFEEAEIEKRKCTFVYAHRGAYWFQDQENPRERFSLPQSAIGKQAEFLKSNTVVEAVRFGDEIIAIKLPVKVELAVKEAPPAIRGNTAQGGSKVVKLETGAELSVPLFIKEGDVIRVNTETGEYVERVTK